MTSAAASTDSQDGGSSGKGRNPLPKPAIRALMVQLLAGAIIVGLARAWSILFLTALPMIAWAMIQAALATLLAHYFSMARWWLAIHMAFLPALVLTFSMSMPSWPFLTGFILLFLVHGATYRTQVPTHLSRRAVAKVVADLLPSRSELRCIDLGCGFGGVLSTLAMRRSDGEYHGIEGAILPFAVSWIRGRLAGYEVSWGDLWGMDLGIYDVVYVYLSPACMPALWTKVRREMRPGSLLISNSFPIPGVAPTQTVSLRPGANVYLWCLNQC